MCMRWNTKIIDFIVNELGGDTSILTESPFFSGDLRLRKAYLEYEYTEEELSALRSWQDPAQFVFSQDFELYRRLMRHVIKDMGDRCDVVIDQDRQVSMSSGIAALICHSMLHGRKAVVVTPNTQTAYEFVYKLTATYADLPFFAKPGIVSRRQKSLAFDNGSTLIAVGSDRHSIIGLSCDEVYMLDASWYRPRNLESLLEFTDGKRKTVIVGNSSQPNETFERLRFECNRFNVVQAKRGLLAERMAAYDKIVDENRKTLGQPQ